jgi:predicted Zn-dependent peptidase
LEFERTRLDNGVRIVTSRMEHVRSASLIIYFGAGSRHERDEHAGVSHFLEHMVFKGTTKRPDPVQITREIEEVGGMLNAATSREMTNYWVKAPSEHLARSFDVLADILVDSTFRSEELEKERWVIFEEIHGIHDTPDDYIHDVIDELIWAGQPIGRPIIGTTDTVGSLTRDDVIDYMRQHYRPDRLVIAAAGDVDHDQVVRLAETSFGHVLPNGERPPLIHSQLNQDEPRVRVLERPTEEAHLCVGLPALPYTDERRRVQDMLDAILSSGMSARLFQEIRERRGLAYAIFGYFRGYVDVGQSVVYAGTDPDKIDETVSAIIGELDKLRDEPVPEIELERTKALRRGRIAMGFEDSRSVAAWIGGQELLYDEILTPEQVVEEIESVSSEQIQALAAEIFVPERLSLAVIGPFDDEARFRRLLD